MSAEQTLKDKGIELPAPISPVATYVRYVRTGNLLLVSGTGPSNDQPKGKLGRELIVAAAREPIASS